MAHSALRLAALCVVLCGSTMTSASKVSCRDTTESSASSAVGPSSITSSSHNSNASISESSNGSGSSASGASFSLNASTSASLATSTTSSASASSIAHSLHASTSASSSASASASPSANSDDSADEAAAAAADAAAAAAAAEQAAAATDTLASVQASEAASTSSHVTIYDEADFGGNSIVVTLNGMASQVCITLTCMTGAAFSWGAWDDIDTNGTFYLSVFPEERCQGGSLGSWQLAANEFPAQLSSGANSYGLWQVQPAWNEYVYGCDNGFNK